MDIAAYYNNLGGLNPNGVEVETILLSTVTTGGSGDPINFAMNSGYGLAGIDATAARTDSRAGYAYYAGVPIPAENAYQSRLVVVNMLAGSASHQQYEILFSSGSTNPDTTTARAAIDAVQAAPAGTTFDAWQTANALPPAENGPTDDPDRDGSPNLVEFHAGTDPLDAASRPNPTLVRTPTGFTYTYRRATDRIGITHTLETGPLQALTAYAPSGESLMSVATDIEIVSINLPPDFGPYLRQSVSLDP